MKNQSRHIKNTFEVTRILQKKFQILKTALKNNCFVSLIFPNMVRAKGEVESNIFKRIKTSVAIMKLGGCSEGKQGNFFINKQINT